MILCFLLFYLHIICPNDNLSVLYERPKNHYILSPLSSNCKNIVNIYTLSIICTYGNSVDGLLDSSYAT